VPLITTTTTTTTQWEAKLRGHSIQHIPVPVPSQDKLGGSGRKGIWRKNGGEIDGGGLLIGPDGVALTRIVGVSGSCYSP